MSTTLLLAVLLAAPAAEGPSACDQRFGNAEETERLHREQLTSKRDAASCNALASFLMDRCWNNERRDDAITTLEDCAAADPENAEIRLRIATLCWDSAQGTRDEAEKAAVVRRGLDSADVAIMIAPEYSEAMIYKGLLLRALAELPSEAPRKKKLLAEADALKRRAQAVRKRPPTESP